LSWSSVSSKNNIHIEPVIQIFCKDIDNKNVYVRLGALSTILVEFVNNITDDDLVEIFHVYRPKYAASSIINSSISMRGATIDNYEDYDKELSEFEQDPEGLLSSFWKARNIKVYGWIYVEKYEILKRKYTKCDIEIKTSEEFVYPYVNDLKISTNKLFWYIETISPDRNFTDTENINHEILLILKI
jgi:hypothetical protein